MIDKRVKNIIEAVSGAKSGMTFMFGGFGLSGIPENAIAELSKKVLAKEFTTIDTRTAKIILLEAGGTISDFTGKSFDKKNFVTAHLGVQGVPYFLKAKMSIFRTNHFF